MGGACAFKDNLSEVLSKSLALAAQPSLALCDSDGYSMDPYASTNTYTNFTDSSGGNDNGRAGHGSLYCRYLGRYLDMDVTTRE